MSSRARTNPETDHEVQRALHQLEVETLNVPIAS